jgi:hypothetical protein
MSDLFVSYSFTHDAAHGFGWVVIRDCKPPATVEELQAIVATIDDDNSGAAGWHAIPISWKAMGTGAVNRLTPPTPGADGGEG